MGKCDNCKKKIMYNKYKRYRKQILCLECYSTRLERKVAKKVIRRRKAKELVTPIEEEEKQDVGLVTMDAENVKTEDSN